RRRLVHVPRREARAQAPRRVQAVCTARSAPFPRRRWSCSAASAISTRRTTRETRRALRTARAKQTWSLHGPPEGGHYRNERYPSLFPAVYHSLSISRVGGQRSLPADSPVGPPPAGISNSVMTPSAVTRPS